MIVIVAFAIANFEPVTLDLWPFDKSLSVPMSVALLTSLVLGLLIGGLVAWLSAAGSRRSARRARRRLDELERELARLRRDRADAVPPTEDPGQAAERAQRPAIGP